MTDPGPTQSSMTSNTLLSMIRFEANHRLGYEFSNAGKSEILHAVHKECGVAVVFELGREVRGLRGHPVLDAVSKAADPLDVLRRWIRVERFGHTHNRTRILHAESGSHQVTLEHHSRTGSGVDPLSDLFMWGIFTGLLERASVATLALDLVQADGSFVAFAPRPDTKEVDQLPQSTSLARLRWTAPVQDAPLEESRRVDRPTAKIVECIEAVLRTDLICSWRVADVSQRLGTSPRQLQRVLRSVGTTFGDLLRQTRTDAARHLLVSTGLSMVEVAFCTGFSDAAHFSRAFRRVFDVPPSAFRDLIHGLANERERKG